MKKIKNAIFVMVTAIAMWLKENWPIFVVWAKQTSQLVAKVSKEKFAELAAWFEPKSQAFKTRTAGLGLMLAGIMHAWVFPEMPGERPDGGAGTLIVLGLLFFFGGLFMGDSKKKA